MGREVPGATALIDQCCTGHDYRQPGKPRIARDDPDARNQLVDALITDAHRLLARLPEQESGSRAAETVALLALVADQDVEPADGSDGTDGRLNPPRRRDLLEDQPVTVLADSAYGSGEFPAELAPTRHIDRVKPPPITHAHFGWLHPSMMSVGHENRTATCRNGADQPDQPHRSHHLRCGLCHCALGPRCIRSRKGKQLKVGAQDARRRTARRAARG